jgi:hypothetical protein
MGLWKGKPGVNSSPEKLAVRAESGQTQKIFPALSIDQQKIRLDVHSR